MTSQQKKQAFNSLFVVVFAVTLGYSVINPFFPVYMKTITGQGIIIALVFSGFSLAKIIFTPFLCKWSDSVSRRLLIFSGLILHTLIASFFCLLPENIFIILGLRFFQGVATAMIRPIAQAFVGDISPENREGSSMGTFDVSFYAALGIGPLLGGITGGILGYRGMFVVLLLMCATALLITALTMPGERKFLAQQTTAVHDFAGIFANPTLQGLFVFIFSRSFGIVVVPIFLPLFLHTYMQASHLEIGICTASGALTTAVLLKRMGKISDIWNRRRLVIVGGLMCGAFTLLLPWAQNFRQMMTMTIILSFFSTLSLPASSAILIEQGRSYGLGYTIGISHTIINISFFIGPLLSGLLMDAVGMVSVFTAAGLTGIAGTLFFAIKSTWKIQGRLSFDRLTDTYKRNGSSSRPSLL